MAIRPAREVKKGESWAFTEPQAELIDIPVGDGMAYERLGETVTELAQSVFEYRSRSVWFPASSFEVIALKEIIAQLWHIYGGDGTAFLANLGIDSLDDLRELNGLSGVGVMDLLGAAIAAIPPDDRARLLGRD